MDSNDKTWFSDQIRNMEQTMFHVAFVILGNEADCQDATGSAILTAYEKLPQLRNRASFRAWLIQILKNECYLTLKRRKRMVYLNEATVIENEMHIPDPDLHQALMQLSKDYRLTIVLYYLEGYSIKEIAQILAVSAGTIKSRLSRARTQLKDYLWEE